MNPYTYTEHRFNNYLKKCILNISNVSQKHYTKTDYVDNQNEYLQNIHIEVKTLLNSLESLFSHHKYELINNTEFDLFNNSDTRSEASSKDNNYLKKRNIMDFMNSIISSGPNSDNYSDDETMMYVEDNGNHSNEDMEPDNNTDIHSPNLIHNSINSRFEVTEDSDEETTNMYDNSTSIFTEQYHSDVEDNDDDEDNGDEEDNGDDKDNDNEEDNDVGKEGNIDGDNSNIVGKEGNIDGDNSNVDSDEEEDCSNQVLYNGLCVARVKRKKEFPNDETPKYVYRDEEGYIYGRQCNKERQNGELLCEKHKEKCKIEKFSYIFNAPYNKLTVKNPLKGFDNNECTITLKTIFYGTEKFYWNPKTNHVYDFESKDIIGRKINDEEIIFDDGEDH